MGSTKLSIQGFIIKYSSLLFNQLSSGYSYYEKKLLTKWLNLEDLKFSEEAKSLLMHICTLYFAMKKSKETNTKETKMDTDTYMEKERRLAKWIKQK